VTSTCSTCVLGAVRRLTNDRFADMQPAWSPDGRSLAFVTDRASGPDSAGAGSDFERLRYSRLRLATIDVASGRIRVLRGAPNAKHINPQYSADGGSLYFVADLGGYTDIYRVVVETGAMFRVTRTVTWRERRDIDVAGHVGGAGGTGVCCSPCSTRPASTLRRCRPERAGGEPVMLDDERRVADGMDASAPDTTVVRPATKSAAVLPAEGSGGRSTVSDYLEDSDDGLPADSSIVDRPYRTGVPAGRDRSAPRSVLAPAVSLGTQFAGGASAYFSDMLGNHALGVGLQASGQLRDIGGQLLYINSANRWNWGVNVSRSPYVYSYGALTTTGGAVPDLSPRGRQRVAHRAVPTVADSSHRAQRRYDALRVQHPVGHAGLQRAHEQRESRGAVVAGVDQRVGRVRRRCVVVRVHVADLGHALPLRGDARQSARWTTTRCCSTSASTCS
jgi:hypothetical protein